MKMKIEGLRPGNTYSIQVRSLADAGVSEWSIAASHYVSSDITPPANPTSASADFDGKDFLLSWSDVNPKLSNDFRDFQIDIYSGTDHTIFYSPSDKFAYTLEQNIKDFGTAKSSLSAKISSRDTSGNLSSGVTVSATNLLPPTPTGSAVAKSVVGGYAVNLSGLTGQPPDYSYTAIKANGVLEAKTTSSNITVNTDDCEPREISVFFVDQLGQESAIGLSLGSVTPYSSVLENVIAPTPLSVGGLLASRSFSIISKSSSGTTRSVILASSGTYGGPVKFSRTATGASGGFTVTVSSARDVKLGQLITGTGIASYTSIVGISGSVLTLSKALTGTLSSTAVVVWNVYDGSVGGMTTKDKIVVSGVDDLFNSSSAIYDVVAVDSADNSVDYTASSPLTLGATAVTNSDALFAVANRGQRVAINAAGIEGYNYYSSDTNTGRAFLFPVEGQSTIGGWEFGEDSLYGHSGSSSFVGIGASLIGVPSAQLFYSANAMITKTSGAGTPEIGDILYDGTNTARVIGVYGSNQWYTDGLVTGSITILPIFSGLDSERSAFVSGGTTKTDPSISVEKRGLTFGTNGQITSGSDSILLLSNKILMEVSNVSRSKKLVFDPNSGLVVDSPVYLYDPITVGTSTSSYTGEPKIKITNDTISQEDGLTFVDVVSGNGAWEVKLRVKSSEVWKDVNPVGGAEPAFQSYIFGEWENYGPPFQTVQFRKMPDGIVRIRGLAQATVGAPTGTIFRLPVGYRPAASELFACLTANHRTVRVDVQADGDVTVLGYEESQVDTFLSLSQISFYAGW